MPFTSPLFITFIVLFFPAFWLTESWSRQGALLFTAVASLAFVAINFPLFALIPVIQGALILNFQKSKRTFSTFWLTIILLLAPLLIFKYYDFIAKQIGLSPLHLSLPLGISFYTFTAIGFISDIYKNRYEIKNPRLMNNINLLTFWPHLASGPILRGNNFFFDKDDGHLFHRDITTALVLIIFGLYKKIVIADGVGGLLDQNLETGISSMGALDAWSTIVGFSVRIYGDFSGYSDMAIGFAILMGIYIPANFNYPYAATSLTDFWHRWHISLSMWFRDYVYIPLGGNRNGLIIGSIVLMAVFTVSGLWHGAAWNFVIWGAIHGAILIIERIGRMLNIRIAGFLGWILTFTAVSIAWCFFFLGFSDALELIGRTFAASSSTKFPYNTIAIWVYAALLFVDLIARPYQVNNGVIKATSIGIWLSPVALTVCFYFAGKPLPFIYFDF